MPHFLKVVAINLAVIAAVAITYFAFKARSSEQPTPEAVEATSTNDTGGLVSDGESEPVYQVIDPYDLSKNPFQMKGYMGILDTGHMPLILRSGAVRTKTGMRGIRFDHMVEDRLAIYSILAGVDSLTGDEVDELAVELTDNNPPDTDKPWLVRVEGTTSMVNGLGATVPVATVQFIQYAELPSPPQPATVTSPVQAPLPPNVQQPAPPPPQAPHWEVEGHDWILKSDSGPCATLTLPTESDSPIYMHYGDGPSVSYDLRKLGEAKRAAEEHCTTSSKTSP